MDTEDITRLAVSVAQNVRERIPRSSNRIRAGGEESTWLKSGLPDYVDLLHTLGRTATRSKTGMAEASRVGKALEDTRRATTTFRIPTAKKVQARELKQAVLDFVEKNPVDLSYKLDIGAENAYSVTFANDLAEYLNARGYSYKGAPYSGANVINDIRLTLLEHQRILKYGIKYSVNPIKGETFTPFPLEYILANARNALRFKVGNCEEVGCTAFAMLRLAHWQKGRPLAKDSDTGCKVELVYAKAPEGDAHFFVVLNRPDGDIRTTLGTWAANPDTVVCDPWFTDGGLGGPIHDEKDAAMTELRQWLLGPEEEGPAVLAVRATDWVGQGLPSGTDLDTFRLGPRDNGS